MQFAPFPLVYELGTGARCNSNIELSSFTGAGYVLKNAMASCGHHVGPRGILYNLTAYDVGESEATFSYSLIIRGTK